MKKDLAVILGLFLVIVFLLIFGRGFSSVNMLGSGTSSSSSAKSKSNVNIALDTLTINAQVALQPSDRKKGLSKKDSLPIDSGMLFVFEKSGNWAIWMKDMRFAIDIIWLDESKRVVDIATNVPPQPGKSDKDLTIYTPKASAKYVLEVNAGLSALHNVKVGDIASFSL